MRKSKYNNKKTCIDGIKFDSKKEGEYYLYLKNQKLRKKILNFEMQVKYNLIPAIKDRHTGKSLERAVSYKADFVVTNLDNSESVIDVKGMRTQVYIIKRKLMLYTFGIRIIEV